MRPTGNAVLKMEGLTPFCLGDRLYVFRPEPTRLQDDPSSDPVTNIYEFKLPLFKTPNFIGRLELFIF
jgi:hypothetical protein